MSGHHRPGGRRPWARVGACRRRQQDALDRRRLVGPRMPGDQRPQLIKPASAPLARSRQGLAILLHEQESYIRGSRSGRVQARPSHIEQDCARTRRFRSHAPTRPAGSLTRRQPTNGAAMKIAIVTGGSSGIGRSRGHPHRGARRRSHPDLQRNAAGAEGDRREPSRPTAARRSRPARRRPQRRLPRLRRARRPRAPRTLAAHHVRLPGEQRRLRPDVDVRGHHRRALRPVPPRHPQGPLLPHADAPAACSPTAARSSTPPATRRSPPGSRRATRPTPDEGRAAVLTRYLAKELSAARHPRQLGRPRADPHADLARRLRPLPRGHPAARRAAPRSAASASPTTSARSSRRCSPTSAVGSPARTSKCPAASTSEARRRTRRAASGGPESVGAGAATVRGADAVIARIEIRRFPCRGGTVHIARVVTPSA